MKKFFQRVVQFVCVLFIAIGVGLVCGAGTYHDDIMPEFSPQEIVSQINEVALSGRNRVPIDPDDLDQRLLVTVGCYGAGVGLSTLGLLGLFVPWANGIRISDINDNGLKAVGVLATALALASVLMFGVSGVSWSHWAPFTLAFLLVCTVATIWVAIIIGWRPWLRSNPLPKVSETVTG